MIDISPCCLLSPSLPWPPYICPMPPRWGQNDARAAKLLSSIGVIPRFVCGVIYAQICVRASRSQLPPSLHTPLCQKHHEAKCRLDVDSDYRKALVGVALRSATWASIHTLGGGLIPLSKVDHDGSGFVPTFVLFIQQSISPPDCSRPLNANDAIGVITVLWA
jgi:hypothetical protein